jgi:hypothetical protein
MAATFTVSTPMVRGFIRACLALSTFFSLVACHSTKETLTVHDVPNYSPKAAPQTLFLDFEINQSTTSQSERVTLVNSIIGNGGMKSLARPVHNPYQIKLVRHFADGRLTERDSLEHPLFRSIEIAEPDGTLSQKPLREHNGHFSVRVPYVKALDRIDMYSVTPDKGLVKIHTIRLRL